MKLSHTKLIVISGLIWFAIGVYLLQLGINLLLSGVDGAANMTAMHYPLVSSLKPYLGSVQSTALMLVVMALFIGYLKGRYVLGKSAQRGVTRILSFPNPTYISSIYSAKYYILLALMVGLGISVKYMGLSNDVRGLVDAIIGSALINGAMIYFKLAQGIKAR